MPAEDGVSISEHRRLETAQRTYRLKADVMLNVSEEMLQSAISPAGIIREELVHHVDMLLREKMPEKPKNQMEKDFEARTGGSRVGDLVTQPEEREPCEQCGGWMTMTSSDYHVCRTCGAAKRLPLPMPRYDNFDNWNGPPPSAEPAGGRWHGVGPLELLDREVEQVRRGVS